MTLIIAEIAQAHDGSEGMLESLVRSSLKAGADAIKLQLHYAEHESTYDETFRIQLSNQYSKRFDYWKHVEIKDHLLLKIKKIVQEEYKKKLIISPFSEYAIHKAQKIGIDYWKIASGEIYSDELINEMLSTKIPIIASTGLTDNVRLDFISNLFMSNQPNYSKHGILHCVSSYPTPPSKANLARAIKFKSDYPELNIGISDHSGTTHPGIFAISHNLNLIEVHVTFSRDMYGPDSNSSITFKELAYLAQYKEFIGLALGDGSNQPMDVSTKDLFTKSLCTKTPLPKGHVVKDTDLCLKKPGTGINPKMKKDYVGRKLARNVSNLNILKPRDFL